MIPTTHLRHHGPRTLAGLCLLGALVVGCAPAPTRTAVDASSSPGTGGVPATSSGGSGGSATGGSVGSSTGGSGGSSATGGGGGSATGGSGGSDSTPDAAVTSDAGGGGTSTDGGGGGGGGGGPVDPNNPCFKPGSIKNRTLPNLSVKDFCDGYEKWCPYPPKGPTTSVCGKGQPVGPLYTDRADCEAKYGAAAPSAKACRAGQLCVNGPAGLMINACSHGSGYCAGACIK